MVSLKIDITDICYCEILVDNEIMHGARYLEVLKKTHGLLARQSKARSLVT